MVDKKVKPKQTRSTVDKHNDGAGSRYAKLEERLAEFISKFDCMATEMNEIKRQQAELIEFVKEQLIKK